MFDAKELKNNLTLEDYEKIMFELGAEPKKRTTEYIIYNTGDHHLDWEDGSPKLYFYIETKSFFSYTASCSFDIIGLVEKRWELEGLDYTFNDILVWIANVVGLSTDTIEINKKSTQCSWKTVTPIANQHIILARYMINLNYPYAYLTIINRLLTMV